jgi:hypothetical protein
VNVQATQFATSFAVQPTRTETNAADKIAETAISEQDLELIRTLKVRDQVVRAHEAAHIAAGSGIVLGGATYSYQRGPDGVQYAVGGEVSIDTSKVAGDPNATLQKAQQIQAAALAPAQPSSQDRNVAAKAAQMAVEARAEIAQQLKASNVAPVEETSGDESANKQENTLGSIVNITA